MIDFTPSNLKKDWGLIVNSQVPNPLGLGLDNFVCKVIITGALGNCKEF